MAQLPYRGSIPTAPSKGLTVEEMLKKYPKGNVEKAIYRLDYVSQRNRMIKSYEDMIDSGHNVELATKALDMYLESTPSEPPIDPDEPADLDPDVLWRIKCLKYIYHGRPVVRPESILDLDFESVDPDCMVNLNAILNAYRSGNLRVVAGEASVWFAGHLVIGPLPNNKLSNYEIIHKVSEWREKYGPGRAWEENPTARRRQRKFQGIMPAVDDNWTHIVS
ncbi:hypothetical protein BDV24DRAFT_126320 [Aspergillus arachidicola]|uniref:Uncharacterized protein n=1 Tax=Aspergillus arachidicola TaxID=656916 RepID=A0A5N6YJU4_9EURO|nr:hypothetical protein BDV24DRAFT_126320 [Aspergillus arachidicola]